MLVAGFPYVRERYFATFRHWPEPDGIRFILPKRWPIKNSDVVFTAPDDPRVIPVGAYFWRYHATTPIIGGLLKGWMPAFPLHLWRMRRWAELVYACSEPTLLSTLWFAVFSKLLGKKFVCFTWENIPYRQKYGTVSYFVHMAIMRMNLLLSDGLICGNEDGRRIHSSFIDSHYSFRKPVLATIAMNGVDPDAFVRRQDPLSHLSSHIVFAYVGALGYRKGVHIAIQALKAVLADVPNAHLIIAGAGEYEKQIDRLIADAGVREHITRLPWVHQKDLVRLLSVSDVFLYPSIPQGGWAEQFGYSMAEASLMELPIISTRSGSIADVVVDGQTGILVPPDDVDALVSAMKKLGQDAQLRVRMGRAGRTYIAGKYSHTAVARAMLEFFDRLQ